MFKAIKESFRKPKGLLGVVAGKIMEWENKTLNQWGIRHLQIRPGNRILEVGFGPGYSLDYMLDYYRKVEVHGIDISETMTNQAEERLQEEAAAGRVKLMTGDIGQTKLPQQYDRILTVNNYTLWEDREKGLRNVYESLQPGGRVVIVMQPREEDASSQKTYEYSRFIQKDLRQCGFRKIRVRFKKIKPELAVCVTALKRK